MSSCGMNDLTEAGTCALLSIGVCVCLYLCIQENVCVCV